LLSLFETLYNIQPYAQNQRLGVCLRAGGNYCDALKKRTWVKA
jgi:hypothetical protein